MKENTGFFDDKNWKDEKLSEVKPCKYDKTVQAVKECVNCGAGLCRSCGYFFNRKVFCNECYHEEFIKEQEGEAQDLT